MKEIKDYLHLYLGCYGQNETLMANGTWRKEHDTYLTHELLSYVYKGQSRFKPILRPLSSLTDEEKSMVSFDAYRVLRKNMKSDLSKSGFIWAANQTAYLLSKHFDLFGLIEAGLAIDSTTLNNHT